MLTIQDRFRIASRGEPSFLHPPLSGFAEIIKTAVESVDEGERTWQKYRIEDGLVHAVIRLIDSANGDNELTECCLDILDEIYRKRILTDSAISKLLEGAE